MYTTRLSVLLDGGWDADDRWIGAIVNAHTNLTEIVSAMDLLWRNDIHPSQVVMGLGFYGRSKYTSRPRAKKKKIIRLLGSLTLRLHPE